MRNLPTPTSSSEPATKGYVDGRTSKWVKVSNLTLNDKTSTSAQTPLGSFNTFSLDSINAIRSVRFKGNINIPSLSSTNSNGGLTLFGTFNSISLYLVKYLRDRTLSYVFPIDIIIPAALLNGTEENNTLYKIIYIPMLTYTGSNYTSRSFGGDNTPKMFNDAYSYAVSCNIDMYLEVVE